MRDSSRSPLTGTTLGAIISVVYLLGATDRRAPSQPADADTQRKANLDSFDQVWKTVRDRHWDPKLGGLDWQAAYDELRPKMEKAETRAEGRAILRDLLGRLKQSHFEIFAVDAYEEKDSAAGEGGRDGTAGIHARVIDGKALLIRVEEGSAAEKMGVKPGWVVRAVDGKELGPEIAAVVAKHSGSTALDSKLAWLVMAPMSGRLDEKVSVEFLDGGDRPVHVEIPFARRLGHKHRSGNLPPRYIRLESRVLDGNVGYAAFTSWIDEPYLTKAFDEALASFKDAPGVVIDLRGARGGIGTLPPAIAGRFVREPKLHLGTMTTRQGKFTFGVKPQPKPFDGRVAVLIDGCSRSASEIFAAGMRDLGRARLFGMRTVGAVLPSVVDKLPTGDSFQYAIADYVTPKGERIEGIGVRPDVEIVPKREDLLAGRDPILDTAVTWIRSGQ
jgi:carboxyl-terminal processing protease